MHFLDAACTIMMQKDLQVGLQVEPPSYRYGVEIKLWQVQDFSLT